MGNQRFHYTDASGFLIDHRDDSSVVEPMHWATVFVIEAARA